MHPDKTLFKKVPNTFCRSSAGFTEYTHRVAMAAFWRTFQHDGKIIPEAEFMSVQFR
jgi:hypothetical protein